MLRKGSTATRKQAANNALYKFIDDFVERHPGLLRVHLDPEWLMYEVLVASTSVLPRSVALLCDEFSSCGIQLPRPAKYEDFGVGGPLALRPSPALDWLATQRHASRALVVAQRAEAFARAHAHPFVDASSLLKRCLQALAPWSEVRAPVTLPEAEWEVAFVSAVDDEAELTKQLNRLWRHVNPEQHRRDDPAAFGLDVEWGDGKMIQGRTDPDRIGVLQLATADTLVDSHKKLALVIYGMSGVDANGGVPPIFYNLASLFGSRDAVWCGVGILGDTTRLHKQFGFRFLHLLDPSWPAVNQRSDCNSLEAQLLNLCGYMLPVDKEASSGVRLSDWLGELTAEQLRYAAADGMAGAAMAGHLLREHGAEIVLALTRESKVTAAATLKRTGPSSSGGGGESAPPLKLLDCGHLQRSSARRASFVPMEAAAAQAALATLLKGASEKPFEGEVVPVPVPKPSGSLKRGMRWDRLSGHAIPESATPATQSCPLDGKELQLSTLDDYAACLAAFCAAGKLLGGGGALTPDQAEAATMLREQWVECTPLEVRETFTRWMANNNPVSWGAVGEMLWWAVLKRQDGVLAALHVGPGEGKKPGDGCRTHDVVLVVHKRSRLAFGVQTFAVTPERVTQVRRVLEDPTWTAPEGCVEVHMECKLSQPWQHADLATGEMCGSTCDAHWDVGADKMLGCAGQHAGLALFSHALGAFVLLWQLGDQVTANQSKGKESLPVTSHKQRNSSDISTAGGFEEYVRVQVVPRGYQVVAVVAVDKMAPLVSPGS